MVGVSQGAASACPRREREGGVGAATQARTGTGGAAAPARPAACAQLARAC